MSNKYYKVLIKIFGHADNIGCTALAHAVAAYEDTDTVANAIKKASVELKTTYSTLTKRIERYIELIMKDITIEELSKMLDYSFNINYDKPNIRALIPILKLRIDEEE